MNLSRNQLEIINNTEKTLGIKLTDAQIKSILGIPETIIKTEVKPLVIPRIRITEETDRRAHV